MENMYYLYCGRLQHEIDGKRKWAEAFGPQKQYRIERAVQRRLEQFNLRGFYVQGREEKKKRNSKPQEVLALGKGHGITRSITQVVPLHEHGKEQKNSII
jgi:hypothetical protein